VSKKKKQRYRIRNWPDYNKALIAGGSLTLRLHARSIDKWRTKDAPARRGRRRIYTDIAIECGLLLREVYHLP